MQQNLAGLVKKYAKGTSINDIAETLEIVKLKEKLEQETICQDELNKVTDLMGIEEDLEALDTRLLKQLKSEFKEQIIEYSKKHKLSQRDFGKAMFKSRAGVKGWFTGGVVPPLETFFEVQVMMTEGHKKTMQQGEKYLKKKSVELAKAFMAHYDKEIKHYCAEKNIFVTDFAKLANVGRNSLYSIANWEPGKKLAFLPKYSKYLKIMTLIKGDSVDDIFDPLFNPYALPDKKPAEKHVQELEELESNPEKEDQMDRIMHGRKKLDELLEKYDKMNDKAKALILQQVVYTLGTAVNHFRKGNESQRDILRKVCGLDMEKLGSILMLAQNIIRNEDDYQHHLEMNKEHYKKFGGK